MHHRLVRSCSYGLVILMAITVSLLPDLYRLQIAPEGTTYPLIHNHPHDYFSYLGYMRTGLDGGWLTTVRESPEHFAPQFVYTFFVLLGHLARLTGISLPSMYLIARLCWSVGLLATCLLVLTKLFSSYWERLTGLLLVCFATGFWIPTQTSQGIRIDQFLSFWTHFDPIMRTTFLPHHLASSVLGLGALLFFSRSLEHQQKKDASIAGVLGCLAGVIYHGTITNILGATALLLFFLTVTKPAKKAWHFVQEAFLPTVLFVGPSCLSLAYIVYLTHTTWPWTLNSNLAAQFTFSISFWEYVWMLGPPLILTLVGIPLLLQTDSMLPRLLLAWAIFPFVGLFVLAHLYPQYGNMPYMEATSYIPLGMLSVYGLQTLKKWTGRFGWYACTLLTAVMLLYSIPALVSSVHAQQKKFSPMEYNIFLPNSVIEGFDWLDTFTPRGATVLSGGLMGSIIPAYSHNYLVYGDDVNTYQAAEKHADMLLFFREDNPASAAAVLDKYHVQYVFFGPDTDPPKDPFLASIHLEKMYNNEQVTIYKNLGK